MAYRRSPIVLQKPPSPLHMLLSGLGYGITGAMQRYMSQKQKSRDISQDVIKSVLQGDLPSEVMATDVFKTYASMANIDKRPEIKALTDQAMEEFRPPPVTKELAPPFKPVPGAPMGLPGGVVTVPQAIQPEYVEKGVPWEAYQKKMLEKEDVKAQRKLEGELTEFQAKEIFKDRIKRSSHLPLNKRIDIAEDGYKQAIEKGWSVDDFTITDPESGVKINIETYTENLNKQQIEKAKRTTEGIAYLNAWKEYNNIQIATRKAIHNFTMGKDVREGIKGDQLEILNRLLPKKLSEKDIKVQLRNLLPLWSEKLEIQHRILRKRAKLVKEEDLAIPPLKSYGIFDIKNPDIIAGEIERIGTLNNIIIGSLKEEVDEEQKKLTDVDVRDKVIVPRRRIEEEEEEEETVDPSEVAEDEHRWQYPNGDIAVARNGKWVKVKKK